MHGLTFIALANSPVSRRRWRDEERARKAGVDRHKLLTLALKSELSAEERNTLLEIENQLAAESPTTSSRDCPECRRPFVVVYVCSVAIDCCRSCRGIWFDAGELQAFSGQAKEIPADNLANRPSRFDCPICQARMIEFVFVNPGSLLVDRCPTGHGVFLEEKELERVFELS